MSDLFTTAGLVSADRLDSAANVTQADTGDLRRKYNFSDKVSELAIQQDPFFRLVSKVAKKPTDDPHFKFAEKRHSWHKRYAYVTNHGTSAQSTLAGTDASVTHTNVDVGDQYFFTMATDFKSEGNIQNKFGQSTGEISVGDAGTQPLFFLPGQLVKIPYMTGVTAGSWDDSSAAASSTPSDYMIAKVLSVDTDTTSTVAILKTEIVRKGSGTTTFELASYSAYNNALDGIDISGKTINAYLEPKRCYVVGNTFSEGSGYPETWKDQPFSTQTGNTQIFKTTCAMTNTARATVLKYEGNEWARIWKNKLIEHKYDIEQSILFGASSLSAGGTNTTQGAVDYILSNGNIFGWSTSKSQDDFLDDMSSYLDPRYNDSTATVYMCSTAVYNWFHKLGGYALANLKTDGLDGSSQTVRYTGDLAVAGKKNILGLGVLQVNTPYGDMNIIRNIHLDGTNIDILGINLKNVAYRPLVGNGVNRDTSIYVGVQTLENSGVDRRVDQILTEAGMEFSMAESHAIWKSS